MKVCYFGTYRASYSRNRIMIEGLRRSGVTVVECHAPLWRGIEDRVAAVKGGWQRPAFWWRIVVAYTRLLAQFWPQRNDFDVIVCGYPGQFDVYLARLLSWWTRTPLVWDVFMSIYLIALERKLDAGNSIILDLLRRAERIACRLPDRLILDTPQYVDWFHNVHDVAADRFRLVPTGADSALFQALPPRPPGARPFRVLYYGTYIPNHDAPAIVAAAHLLSAYTDIHFELVGDGPDRAQCAALAEAAGLANVTFVDWLPQAALIARAADADVCLGAFGATPQSLMTVQNKIYEGLALQRPVITGDSMAVRAALRAGEEVLLCARGDPQALASAILRLYFDADLRSALATAGNRRFAADYTLEALGARFRDHLAALGTPGIETGARALSAALERRPPAAGPLVSVVIPNLNSPLVGVTVEALHRQTLPAAFMEIIVVGRDDAGLVDEDARVRKVAMAGRPSAAANRNRGMAVARGEIICFTDADCIPAPDWLATLLADFADPAVQMVGGGVRFAPGNYWSTCDHFSWFAQFLTSAPAGQRDHLPSLNLALRKTLYAAAGGFDESFPIAAGEDTEWTARIASGGTRLHFNPKAQVTHAAQRHHLRDIWRHAYSYGRYSPKVSAGATAGRDGFYRLLPQQRWALLLLAPLLATLATLRTLRWQPRPAAVLALPGIWLTKLAWCLGAAAAAGSAHAPIHAPS